MKVQVVIDTNGEALGIPSEPAVSIWPGPAAVNDWNSLVLRTAEDHGWTLEQLAEYADVTIDELGYVDQLYVQGDGVDIRRWTVEVADSFVQS